MYTKPVLLLQTGDAPPDIMRQAGNFNDMFIRTGGFGPATTITVNVPRGERPALPGYYRGIVITGSHSMVTDNESWMEPLCEWLRSALEDEVPVFGVCFGHQVMAHALGGVVEDNPNGGEVGTFDIMLTEAGKRDPFLIGLPETFPANLSHRQSVVTPPPGAVTLATSQLDAHQILRYGPKAISVQFHPEFDSTAMLAYLDMYAAEEPHLADVHTSRKSLVQNTLTAKSLLSRFIASAYLT